jgi:carnitine O-octanoyltransferase
MRLPSTNHIDQLEQWWLEYAYLRGRQSLVPFSNMSAAMPPQPFWPDTNQSTEVAYRAALVLRFTLDFYCLLWEERMRPMLHKQHYWSMDQFRRLFNTCRVPQPEVDRLETYFRTRFQSDHLTSTDIIIFYRGHIFRIAAFESITPNDQQPRICSIRKLYEQLKAVLMHSKCAESAGPGVPALTSAPRDRWAKNRVRLLELSDRNRFNLQRIEQSLLCVSFDQKQPQTASQRLQYTMCGPPDDRWADKSVCHVFYANGAAGAICDHTPFDGFASALLTHYVLTCLNECAGRWPESALDLDSDTLESEVMSIDFDLNDSLRTEIDWARDEYSKNCARLQMLSQTFDGYGKKMLKLVRLHPEALIQVALQVAYERVRRMRSDLHQVPPTCYCTASTRQFHNGRTETVRACTAESAELARLIVDQRDFVSFCFIRSFSFED